MEGSQRSRMRCRLICPELKAGTEDVCGTNGQGSDGWTRCCRARSSSVLRDAGSTRQFTKCSLR
eukprot:1784436-Pleurochrysis_carterae.AAC.1